MGNEHATIFEKIVALFVGGHSRAVSELEIASRLDPSVSTRELAPPLLEFLDSLSMVSRSHFPQGGLLVGNFQVTNTPSHGIPTGESESRERLVAFFACVTGDTALERLQSAEATVSEFLEVINSSYPRNTVHFRLHQTRGWFDCLQTWVISDDTHVYFSLNWSVS